MRPTLPRFYFVTIRKIIGCVRTLKGGRLYQEILREKNSQYYGGAEIIKIFFRGRTRRDGMVVVQPAHTPLTQKKQKQTFQKKVYLWISGVKKSRLSSSKKVDLRILGAKKSRFNHQKIELKIFNALMGLVQCIQHYIYHNNCIISNF